MIFIECYRLKRCQGCVKLIASKVNCFLNINDLSEVQLCMSSNSWTWECPHTKDGADHVPLFFFLLEFPSLSRIILSSTFGCHLASLSYAQCCLCDVHCRPGYVRPNLADISSFKPSPGASLHVFAKPDSGFNPNNGAVNHHLESPY